VTDAARTIALVARRQVLPAAGRAVSAERVTVDGDLARHRHAFLELAFVAGGRGVHLTEAGERTLARGDAIAVDGTGWHAYRDCAALEVCNLYVAPELLARELAWVPDDPLLGAVLGAGAHLEGGAADVTLDAAELADVLGLLDAFAALAAPSRAREVAHVLLVLEPFAAALVAHRARGAQPLRPVPEPVLRAAALLREQTDRPWSLELLATAVHLDRSHLARGFRAHTGMPPMTFLAHLRAERAAALLLHTEQPVTAIGAAVGWPDPAHFARRFRAHFGVAPSAYRAGSRRP
jgi:AraC family L-rhamnose operon transcriptional activator RhaR